MRRFLSCLWAVSQCFLGLGVAAASEIRYLSGTSNENTVEWEFSCSEGRRCGEWATIPVPSNWELQGFGRYDYGRQDRKHPESGHYRYRFEVPEGWAERRVDLVFEGVMTDAEVRLNGELAGPVHQGAFYRFRFDVSERLEIPGPNLLEVVVHEASSNRSVNRAERDADYWVFGGIFRPVYLEAFPPESIRRMAIDALADGRLSVDLFLDGVAAPRRLNASVLDGQGELIGEPFSGRIEAGESRLRLETRVAGIHPWTAETPHLYTLAVCLETLDPAGRTPDPKPYCSSETGSGDELHRAVERFGFRTVEIRPGDGIYVNGVKVLLKGINRHSFWPSSGRTTSPRISRQDAQLIKEMNLNAVRMSHYPPDEHFLDTADELGLYVLDELAGWKDAYDTPVGRDLVEAMVTRDVNHPSVILWNNGNEGGWNEELDAVFDEHDPQHRPVLHPDSDHPFRGLQTRHYRDWETLRGFLSGNEGERHGEPSIVMPTEFLHGLYDGGHGASLADYWDLIRSSPRGAGGFLWALMDEGVVRADRDGAVDVAGNHAPDGVVGPYREKEGSFFAVREVFSPVVLEPVAEGQFVLASDSRLEVRNDYDFTDLAQVRFDWRLVEFPSPWQPVAETRVIAAGSSQTGSIPPHEVGLLDLDLPADLQQHDALQVEAVAADGRRIRTWSFPLRSARSVRQMLVDSAGSRNPVRQEDLGKEIRLSAETVAVTFDKTSGEITAVRSAGQSISLSDGPRLSTGSSRAVAVESRQSGNAWEVGVRYEGPLESAWWRLEPSGWLRLHYRYRLTGRINLHGIGFDYPQEKVAALRWRGLGPYRVWKNRRQGPTHGVWEIARNDTVTGQAWEYPEFQGFFGGVYWARWLTDEGSFTVVFDEEDRFLHNFTPKSPQSPLNTEVTFPHTSLTFPHAIPAIGTKFHPPEDLGPSGQPNEALGAYSESLYFYFGEPQSGEQP